MYVLGFESSCDETSAAIVKDGRQVLSNVVASSLDFHKKYGGVIPEIASRMQLETITAVAHDALSQAKCSLKDIKLVSVTNTPGLLGSLLVGISFAKAVSMGLKVPLLGVNHLNSHIFSGFLDNPNLRLPCIALVVSGGHTSLFFVKDFDDMQCISFTSDDACGEAFDKVAKILGLGYPGGPIIEKLSKTGNANKIKFKCSQTKNPLGFSFSGIKTAVLYLMDKKHKMQYTKRDIAASFQEAVVEVLVSKALLACQVYRVNRLTIGGGVAANDTLRKRLSKAAESKNISVFFPSKPLCMDNAAMVAGLGYWLFRKGRRSSLSLTA